jgi:hypothetical protein
MHRDPRIPTDGTVDDPTLSGTIALEAAVDDVNHHDQQDWSAGLSWFGCDFETEAEPPTPSRSAPLIPVMKTANLRQLDDLAKLRWLHATRLGSILVQ